MYVHVPQIGVVAQQLSFILHLPTLQAFFVVLITCAWMSTGPAKPHAAVNRGAPRSAHVHIGTLHPAGYPDATGAYVSRSLLPPAFPRRAIPVSHGRNVQTPGPCPLRGRVHCGARAACVAWLSPWPPPPPAPGLLPSFHTPRAVATNPHVHKSEHPWARTVCSASQSCHRSHVHSHATFEFGQSIASISLASARNHSACTTMHADGAVHRMAPHQPWCLLLLHSVASPRMMLNSCTSHACHGCHTLDTIHSVTCRSNSTFQHARSMGEWHAVVGSSTSP